MYLKLLRRHSESCHGLIAYYMHGNLVERYHDIERVSRTNQDIFCREPPPPDRPGTDDGPLYSRIDDLNPCASRATEEGVAGKAAEDRPSAPQPSRRQGVRRRDVLMPRRPIRTPCIAPAARRIPRWLRPGWPAGPPRGSGRRRSPLLRQSAARTSPADSPGSGA